MKDFKKTGLFCLFAIFVVLFQPLSGNAATRVSNETANAYYENCRKQEDPRFTPKSQDAFCACTAAKIMKSMTTEELQIMYENTQRGRNMLNKMLIDVYTPCMSYPVEDMISQECYNNEQVKLIKSEQMKHAMCTCSAEKTGAWFVNNGQQIFKRILQANPNITDPLEPILESQAFKSQAYRNLQSCLRSNR